MCVLFTLQLAFQIARNYYMILRHLMHIKLFYSSIQIFINAIKHFEYFRFFLQCRFIRNEESKKNTSSSFSSCSHWGSCCSSNVFSIFVSLSVFSNCLLKIPKFVNKIIYHEIANLMHKIVYAYKTLYTVF